MLIGWLNIAWVQRLVEVFNYSEWPRCYNLHNFLWKAEKSAIVDLSRPSPLGNLLRHAYRECRRIFALSYMFKLMYWSWYSSNCFFIPVTTFMNLISFIAPIEGWPLRLDKEGRGRNVSGILWDRSSKIEVLSETTKSFSQGFWSVDTDLAPWERRMRCSSYHYIINFSLYFLSCLKPLLKIKKCQNQSGVAMSRSLTIGIVSCRDDSVLLYSMVMNAVFVFMLKLKRCGTKFLKLWKKDGMTEFSFM
jgi:hypothetical protein